MKTVCTLLSCGLAGLLLASCGGTEPASDAALPDIDVNAGAPERAGVVEAGSWSGQGCTAAGCHGQVEPIRQRSTEMMTEILAIGVSVGDPDGCVVCHGGDPKATTADAAHKGSPQAMVDVMGPTAFYADPASPWVNEKTCGQCHSALVEAQWRSLMMTEAGKIQGTAWSFGSLEGYEHTWGNYDVKNPPPASRLGTDDYRAYMAVKKAAHPNVFPDAQTQIPAAPTADELDDLAAHPEKAAYTYMRSECQRCHLGVKGRARRGDFRGMGCGACHMPYGNEGTYEGRDQAIDKSKTGRPLVHQLQATRDATVSVNDMTWTGVPVETCTTCHNRGKRIGVSYQGLMESAYPSPFAENGAKQVDLHSKRYISMHEDVHYQAGMLCQDCHTSLDVHGDNMLAGTNLAAIEIECQDCHGTPGAYPWELPLGYGDENGPGVATGPGRGTAKTVPKRLERGYVWPAQDGWLRSARGNPMPEVVRVGDRVLVHTAGGRHLWLDPLKRLEQTGKLSHEARTAMVNVGVHIEKMECYACHSSWAPQCYGCHVKVDYSKDQESFDWVAAGTKHQAEAHQTDRSEQGYDTQLAGHVTESRSYLRWEDPALGVNGEGRVTPLIPGCQTSVTVVGKDGKDIIRNHIFRTTPGSEGGGPDGQLGTDMSPVNPHTTGKARSCESCHASAKALGYGIGGGEMTASVSEGRTVDLMTPDGAVIPKSARRQIEPVKGMTDWSAVVTPDGQQTQTVGHHFAGSGPLSNEQRARMDRHNVCVGCHQQLPEESLAGSALHHAAEMLGRMPETHAQHDALLTKIVLMSAWLQVGGGALVGLMAALGLWLWIRRRRSGIAGG